MSTLEAQNALNEAIYGQMSMGRPEAAPEYLITRTRFLSPMYDAAVDPVLAALGVATVEEWRSSGSEGLVVLRSTVMDPFLIEGPPVPDHVSGFLAALLRACELAYAEVAHAPGA
jgi:hypothetical protein